MSFSRSSCFHLTITAQPTVLLHIVLVCWLFFRWLLWGFVWHELSELTECGRCWSRFTDDVMHSDPIDMIHRITSYETPYPCDIRFTCCSIIDNVTIYKTINKSIFALAGCRFRCIAAGCSPSYFICIKWTKTMTEIYYENISISNQSINIQMKKFW